MFIKIVLILFVGIAISFGVYLGVFAKKNAEPEAGRTEEKYIKLDTKKIARTYRLHFSQNTAFDGRWSKSKDRDLFPWSEDRFIITSTSSPKVYWREKDTGAYLPSTPIGPMDTNPFTVGWRGYIRPVLLNFQIVAMPMEISEETALYIKNLPEGPHEFLVKIPENVVYIMPVIVEAIDGFKIK